MKTHKPKSATFFLEFKLSCVICDFSVTIPLATAFPGIFRGKKGGRGGAPPPTQKRNTKKALYSQKRCEKKGAGGVPPTHKKEIQKRLCTV